jgi:hypothetical protein
MNMLTSDHYIAIVLSDQIFRSDRSKTPTP